MIASAASPPRSEASPFRGSGPPRRSRSAAVALVAALALITAACSSNSDATPSATLPPATPTTATTAPATTTTTKPPSPEAEVEQAYLKATATFYEISKDPDPEDLRLTETRMDPNLAAVQDVLSKAAEASIVARFTDGEAPVPEVSDIKIEGSKATLTSCLVDDGQQVRTTDNAVVDDDVVSRLASVEMQMGQGRWLVQSQSNLNVWADGGGCAR